MDKSFIAPEGRIFILGALALALLFYFIWPWLLIPGLLIVLFFIWFFRNPERSGSEAPDTLFSPADGKIMSITQIDHDAFIGGPAIKVSIFLSVFNVHINRSPLSGTVELVEYRQGKFLPAFKSHASEINERNTIGISGNRHRVLVRQITGFLARRIVCDVRQGDLLKQRQRFGMIKFGSGTDLIFPACYTLSVREKDKVKGGRTPIARFDQSGGVKNDSKKSA